MKQALQKGKVYLVGAGPGDPGLITVRAIECIKKADVVLYDRLISKKILGYRKPGAILRYVGKGKGSGMGQGSINSLILDYAGAGRTVVRLKGGDPFIFGRGQEEMVFLKSRGIDCEVVAGVSSFYSVPEGCGIPLTFRGISSGFIVVTGHEDPSKEMKGVDWRSVAKFRGTIVIMMGLSNLGQITTALMKNGKAVKTPAAVISRGTTNEEKLTIGTLSNIASRAHGLEAPAICVIGDVVRVGFLLNPKLKPLSNKRYFLTASQDLNNDIAVNLKKLGASVQSLPMIRILPNKDTALLDKIIGDVKNFDWLVFTSRHGVYYFLKRFFELNKDKAGLAGRIACVGSGTAAEFVKNNIKVELMPSKFTTQNLGLTLTAKGVSGKKIALLRTKLERDPLKKQLINAGALITDCIVYTIEETHDEKGIKEAVSKKPDGIFFLSPRSVDVFFNRIGKNLTEPVRRAPFFSIGPVTTRALKNRGIKTIRSAKEHTIDGLVRLCLEEMVS